MYIGCSTQRVPSLSNVAILSASGTKSGEPRFVTRSTNVTIAFFDAVSFHDGSGSPATSAKAAAGGTATLAAQSKSTASTAVHSKGRFSRFHSQFLLNSGDDWAKKASEPIVYQASATSYRIEMQFAAMQVTGFGTNAKCRSN